MRPVVVLMPTYNHEPYIAQAIESYVAQKCVFDTLLIIGDDCSTDNTLQIARQWEAKHPDKIKVIANPKNRGLLENYKNLISQSDCDYFAILESDDYWTDPQRLQMQVDFLNSNPDYGMVYTDNIVIDQYGKESPSWCSRFNPVPQGEMFDFLIRRNPICAATVMFRKSIIDQYCNINQYIEQLMRTIDYPFWLSIARVSKVGYLDKKTAAYRSLTTSISNSASWSKVLDFNDNMFAIRKYIIEKFDVGISTKEINKWRAKRLAYMAFKYKKPLLMLRYMIQYAIPSCN